MGKQPPLFYTLEGREPVPCEDAETWGRMFCKSERIVAQTDVTDEVSVSTVFTGIDPNPYGEGEPMLFETLIFGGDHDRESWRWATWEEAETMHHEIVEYLRG